MADIVRILDPTMRNLGRLGLLLLVRLLRRRRRLRGRVVRWRWRGRAPPLLFGGPVGLRVWSHLLVLLGTGLSLAGRSWATKGLTLGSVRVSRLWGRVYAREPA